MKKKLLIGFVLICAFSGSVFADLDPDREAPKNPGAALIIYNNNGYGYEFSQPAMQVFRAALAQDITHMSGIPGFATHPISQDQIPDIIPPLEYVDVLDVTRTGIYDELIKKFGDRIPQELIDEGTPLSYWTAVYDLRFSNTNAGEATITTSGDKSDLNLYKRHLEEGGTLFIQAEYFVFGPRNTSVASLVNAVTKDRLDASKMGLSPWTSSTYPSLTFEDGDDIENFGTDFNDLTEENRDNPMNWVMAGSYPMDGLDYAKPLILHDGDAMLLYWGTEGLRGGSGRLVLSFDINAWGDHFSDYQNGEVTRATFAIIQNIYDLMDGSKQFRLRKWFEPGEIKCNAYPAPEGKFIIELVNNGRYDIPDLVVKDTVEDCLSIKDISLEPKSDKTVKGGKELIWEIDILPKDGGKKTIEIEFEISDDCAACKE